MSMWITSDLVIDDLEMAIGQRKPNARLLHYSAGDSQYTENLIENS